MKNFCVCGGIATQTGGAAVRMRARTNDRRAAPLVHQLLRCPPAAIQTVSVIARGAPQTYC